MTPIQQATQQFRLELQKFHSLKDWGRQEWERQYYRIIAQKELMVTLIGFEATEKITDEEYIKHINTQK